MYLELTPMTIDAEVVHVNMDKVLMIISDGLDDADMSVLVFNVGRDGAVSGIKVKESPMEIRDMMDDLTFNEKA